MALFNQNEVTARVWFMESGIASMVAVSPEGLRAEAGLIGREGFLPTSAALDSDRAPYEAMIQLPDDCLSIGYTDFLIYTTAESLLLTRRAVIFLISRSR